LLRQIEQSGFMKKQSTKKRSQAKYEDILKAAKKLFSDQGYEKTSVRQIVEEANTSMGNLYFHFPNKLSILKTICKNYINILRGQISQIHSLSFSPEVGFALDLKIGYINTLENPKLFPLWLVIRKIPEIHKYSLENKKIRLQKFFGDRIPPEELNSLAMAIQGIADSFYEQKGEGRIDETTIKPGYLIINYSLRLLGYSSSRIKEVIAEVENYIKTKNITTADYFKI
jgi:AcrR family transcriptional regulator